MKKRTWIASVVVVAALAGCGTAAQTSTNPNPTTIPTNTTNTVSTTNTTTTAPAPAATQDVALKSQDISLTVLPGGRLGPDGKMHDSFTTPDFTVVQGVPVKLTVYNYDSGSHTVTNSDLGLNLQAKGSPKDGVPGITTVTFTPTKAGDYTWQCMDPCDSEAGGWAMAHDGYMRGTIHVVPYGNKQYIDIAIKDGLKYAAADKKLHDSYSGGNFTVQAGIPVEVTVENFDTGSHSMTSAGLNLNQIFKGATKEGTPSETTFTFTPTKAGTYNWNCIIPCDGNGWAMSHNGYMAGTITVTP